MTIYIENAVRGFSRYHKYTVGTDLRDISRSVVRLVVRANSERDRLATLIRLRNIIVCPSRPLGIGGQSGIPLCQGLPDEELTSGWANVQSNNYWSSTSNANNPNNAWIVNMWNGNMNANNKSNNNNYVWPVRSGEWLTFETLYRNYLKCRRNKRGRINALRFEIKAEENLFLLLEQILNKSYQPSRSVCFIAVLSRMVEKKVRDKDILWLANTIIFHNPVDNCIIKDGKHLIKHLPPHKSLFHAPEDKGLPIGNLTSQFFANVYLNELDQYVKHLLKCKYYVRYCDDFLIIDESPERLEDIKERIRGFVAERLNLSLNDKYNRIVPVSNGIDFLGYIIRPDYMLVRRRVVNNLRERLADQYVKVLVEKGVSVVIIKETDRYIGKIKERLPVMKIVKREG